MTWICIGLVGHVANGKTTLVKTLTGINTKRNSSEIKSGRTIKLGYANCLVWHCNKCTKTLTSGQEQKFMICCEENMELCNKVSFVDSPGHHSYVQTMIKGTSILDCAIIVTDVRATELQPQTLEHLAILEILGVKSCIVVQNKIDLVTRDKCIENYHMLKKELCNTIAKNAPIVPISAQNSIGIEYIQKYLYKMISSLQIKNYEKNIFTIVRSFDINKPNTDIDKIQGGVIGGTFLGKIGYKVGDILEIRPGYKGQPLQTKIISIFSEKEKVSEVTRGGLYGLGTTLDPCLTKADYLVGNLVGKREELPDIVNEISLKIIRMKNFLGMKKGQRYTILIGNTTVIGTVKEIDKQVTFSLNKYICIYHNKAVIYNSESALYGFGIMNDILNEETPEYKVNQNEFEYLHMLPYEEKKEKVIVKLPIPKMFRENRNTIWGNIEDFSKNIQREEAFVSKFIQEELCLEASLCNQGLRIYKTKITSAKLEIILKKFIKEKVCCEQCNSINTSFKNKFLISCLDCNSDRIIS